MIRRSASVLHTHSVNATVLSMRVDQVVLDGYEVQKAFPGVETHESRMVIPVFPNSQDIAALARWSVIIWMLIRRRSAI